MPDSPRPKRPRVIVTRQLMPHVEARMAELFEVVLSARDHAFSEGELKAAVQDCGVLVPTVTDSIDADIIAAAGERLKLIANFGAGVDHRSEEHTSELQSLMRLSYAVFCLKKKNKYKNCE